MSDWFATAGGERTRRASDAWWALGALVLVAVGGVVARANGVAGWERTAFRGVNDLPGAFSWLFVPVMLLGTLGGVAAVVVVAGSARRYPLAVCAGAAGFVGYLAADLAKQLTERGRPADLLTGVALRGSVPHGFGYPSGHVTVAAAMATAAAPYLPRAGRFLAWVAVGIVAVGRMFAGAHFPLDVLGGLALGAAVGLFVTFVAGRPAVPGPARRGPASRAPRPPL